MPGSGHRAAGPVEVWAARAWNVFNEGRPFSLVYPVLVLLAAAPVGLGPDGPLGLALAGALALASVLAASRSRCAAARCCGWRSPLSVPLLEPWRAPALLLGALAGWLVLHGLLLGQRLLPPAHRRAVDELPALLAPRAHQLRPHERQRARAGAEDGDGAQRRPRCWPRSRAPGRSPRIAAAAALAAAARRRSPGAASPRPAAALPAARPRASRPARRSPGAST